MSRLAGSGSGFLLLLTGTGVAGIAGYVITWLIPREIGFASYATFALFWSFLFLVVSAVSGIQQESARATRRSDVGGKGKNVHPVFYGAWLALAVQSILLLSAPFWIDHAFPNHGWALFWPILVGVGSYVILAIVTGSLYGLSRWPSIFWVVVSEALLRLLLVALVVRTADLVLLAWVTAVPFGLVLLCSWPGLRASMALARLDVPFPRFVANVSRTIVASASMGVLISGFPFILGVVGEHDDREMLSLVILAATFVRAPLVVVLLALQSYFVVAFRDLRGIAKARLLFRVIVLLGCAGVVLSVLGWLYGPGIFALLFPGELIVNGGFVLVLVGSSLLLAVMIVAGALVLADSRHSVYGVAWLIAGISTVVLLLIPIELQTRAAFALIGGPVAGLVVLCVASVSELVSSRRAVTGTEV